MMMEKLHGDKLRTVFCKPCVLMVIRLGSARRAGLRWWRSWLRHCAGRRKVAGSIAVGVGPGAASVSNRNGCQEYFLGVKSVGAYG